MSLDQDSDSEDDMRKKKVCVCERNRKKLYIDNGPNHTFTISRPLDLSFGEIKKKKTVGRYNLIQYMQNNKDNNINNKSNKNNNVHTKFKSKSVENASTFEKDTRRVQGDAE